jgi:hypothetical protein
MALKSCSFAKGNLHLPTLARSTAGAMEALQGSFQKKKRMGV